MTRLSLTTHRTVSATTLNVAPGLLGLPLATPARRLAAMGIDVALIGIASKYANAWLLAAVALVAWHLLRGRVRPPGRARDGLPPWC